MVIFLIVSIAFTYSRSSYLSLAVGLFVYVALKKLSLRYFMIVAITFLLLIFMLPRPGGYGVRLERVHSIILKAENIKTVIVGNLENSAEKGEEAVSFTSHNESNEQTYEVWFIHAGTLYQITTLIAHEPIIRKILETWKF